MRELTGTTVPAPVPGTFASDRRPRADSGTFRARQARHRLKRSD